MAMPFTSLPRYSTSPAPSYASLPSFREETLAYSPRTSRSASPFTGNLIKQWRSVTLILKDQDSTTETPIYSRNSIIKGEVGINDCENVLSVVVQVCYVSTFLIFTRLTSELLYSLMA